MLNHPHSSAALQGHQGVIKLDKICITPVCRAFTPGPRISAIIRRLRHPAKDIDSVIGVDNVSIPPKYELLIETAKKFSYISLISL